MITMIIVVPAHVAQSNDASAHTILTSVEGIMQELGILFDPIHDSRGWVWEGRAVEADKVGSMF